MRPRSTDPARVAVDQLFESASTADRQQVARQCATFFLAAVVMENIFPDPRPDRVRAFLKAAREAGRVLPLEERKMIFAKSGYTIYLQKRRPEP